MIWTIVTAGNSDPSKLPEPVDIDPILYVGWNERAPAPQYIIKEWKPEGTNNNFEASNDLLTKLK